jgi:hypothetical protein
MRDNLNEMRVICQTPNTDQTEGNPPRIVNIAAAISNNDPFSRILSKDLKKHYTVALPIKRQLGQVLMVLDTVQIGGLGHEYIAASGFANGALSRMNVLVRDGVLFSVSPLR